MALNKVDRIPGWKKFAAQDIISDIAAQNGKVRNSFDSYFFKLVGELSGLGFAADRFDRVQDFKSVLAIVPVSAATGEGIPELLLMTSGLCQSYLKSQLMVNPEDTKGIVLEVKEEQGLGSTVDAIIYDGVLRKSDTIVLGGFSGAIVSKVKAILVPSVHTPDRVTNERFHEVDEAPAAMGVKIVGQGFEGVIPGSPIFTVGKSDVGTLSRLVMSELESIRISSDAEGVVVKADALGSLEAVVDSLKRREIRVRYADVGNITRRDVLEASVTKKENSLDGVILAFNVRFLPGVEEEAKTLGIPVFESKVIYETIESYTRWREAEATRLTTAQLSELIRPGKFKILPGYVFRRSNPAVVGVEILAGSVKPGQPIMDASGRPIGSIMQIQNAGKVVNSASKGESVAVSIKGDVLVGRQINEGDTLFVQVPEEHSRLLRTKFNTSLSEEELSLLEELKVIYTASAAE